jgi:hypothetical protein
MAKAVSVKDWKEITEKAVTAAKSGDAKARDWLSRHLVGDDPFAVANLAQELEQLKDLVRDGKHVGQHPQRPGTPEAGSASAVGQPDAGAADAGQGQCDGTGGDATGFLAASPTAELLAPETLALFPPGGEVNDGRRPGSAGRPA